MLFMSLTSQEGSRMGAAKCTRARGEMFRDMERFSTSCLLHWLARSFRMIDDTCQTIGIENPYSGVK
jgi:hypothetical protein